MALSTVLSATCKQQRSQEIGELSVRRSTSLDDFANQQFNKNRKVIIRNVPRVTYDVRTNELIALFDRMCVGTIRSLVFTRIWMKDC